MKMKRIMTVACYETRLVRRSWIFLIFTILGIIGIPCIQFLVGDISVAMEYSLNVGRSIWNLKALPSFIPYMNAYFFNGMQVLMIVFFVSEIEKRTRITTMEPLWTRPATNGELMWGRVLGIGCMIIVLNVISVLVTMSIHMITQAWAFDAGIYLFYFLTLTLPSLIFFLGLSMFVVHWIRFQGLAILLLLVFIAGMIGSTGWLHGMLDPLARTIPVIFSVEIGCVNLGLFLLQRLMFMCLGGALLFFSIFYEERLTGKSEKKNILRLLGIGLLVIAVFAGGSYEGYFIKGGKQRDSFRQAYIRSEDKAKIYVLEHEIYFKEKVKRMEASSRMKICNKTGKELSSIILYLNPSLIISRLTCEGQETRYLRDEQVVEIDRTVQVDDTLKIEIEYKGGINERVCYLDLSDKEFYDTQTNSVSIYRFGNRQAFVGEEVTLLQPECLWYPQGVAPINLSSLYDRQVDFTRYSLIVENAVGRTAVSQGIPERLDGKTFFRHDHALQGISLSIAEYENCSIEVDGTQYDIFFFKGSDFLVRAFEAPKEIFKTVIRDIKFMTESTVCQMDNGYKEKAKEVWRMQGKVEGESPEAYSPSGRYPYKWFIAIETPISFCRPVRGWALGDERQQAGIVFLPERVVHWRGVKYDMKKGREVEEWNLVERNNLKGDLEMIFKSANCNVVPMFSGNTFFMKSNEFPAIHEVIKTLGVPIDKLNIALQAPEKINDVLDYLRNHSLEQAFTDKNVSPKLLGEIIEWKTIELKEYLKHELSEDKLYDFYNRFFQEHLFETIDIDQFCKGYMDWFGQDLKGKLRTWYSRDRLPVLLLEDVVLSKLHESEENVRGYGPAFARFKVYNPGDLEGLVIVPGAKIQGKRVNSFLICGHECKEIRLKKDYPGLTINFPLAQNVPPGRLVLVDEMRPLEGDTLTGIFPADSMVFLPRLGEIIVDNRDEGFKLIEPQGEKLFTLLRGGPKSWEQTKRNYERWVEMIDNRLYGSVVHDAYCKCVGEGKYKAEWTAQIPESGEYEVYFYNGDFFKMGLAFQARKKGTSVYYTVCDQSGDHEIRVEPAEESVGWVSLGKYYFGKGEAKVVLDDRGIPQASKIQEEGKPRVMQNKQMIVADAVKWVRRGR